MENEFISVSQKHGGGYRFIEVSPKDFETMTLMTLTEHTINIFFPNRENGYGEKFHELAVTFTDSSGETLNLDETTVAFLNRKGIYISRTHFIQSSYEPTPVQRYF